MVCRLILLFLLSTLTACGFHLRDSVALSPALQTLRIESVDSLSPLPQELGRSLLRLGVDLTENPTAPAALIRIFSDSQITVPLSFSGAARVQEYQVVHRVEFEVIGSDARPLLEKTVIERKRDYRFDETLALGAAAEDELARKELRHEMLQAILLRLETVGH